MTFTYAPSAAGISWIDLSETINQRMEMQEKLLELSKNTTAIQCNLTSETSDQTMNELMAQAQGIEDAANASIGGAAAGIFVSVGSLGLALKTMPTSESQTLTNDVGVAEKPVLPGSNTTEMEDLTPPNPTPGSVQLEAQNTASSPAPTSSTSTNTQSGAPSNNETGGRTTAVRAQMNKYFSEHGSVLAQTVNSGISASGQASQADETRKQAIAKSIEAAAQGIAAVMNQQQSMLSSSIGSTDTSFNNTEGTITTIIQVSAVRG